MKRFALLFLALAALATANVPSAQATKALNGAALVAITNDNPPFPGYWQVIIYYYLPKVGVVNVVQPGPLLYPIQHTCAKVFDDLINQHSFQNTVVNIAYTTAYPAGTPVLVAPKSFVKSCYPFEP